MENLKYTIDDKTIANILGRQNFINAESAILEIVKNAYDAGASELIIEVYENSLIFTDNGDGLNYNDIKTKWMSVGVSDKDYKFNSRDNEARVLAGSMGVGRFALARLGENIVLESYKNDSKPIVWKTDWITSTVQNVEKICSSGTSIKITGLHDNWNEKLIFKTIDFLSRTYKGGTFKIKLRYAETNYDIKSVYTPIECGKNALSRISFNYNSVDKNLKVDVQSDEFVEEAGVYYKDFKLFKETYNIYDELLNDYTEKGKKKKKIILTNEEFNQTLTKIGSFFGEFSFYFKSTDTDRQRFLYKKHDGIEKLNTGVILYRNDFSISSYHGDKDWLGLSKRTRKSPATATHPTGSWRVRDNQLDGFVFIDKKVNEHLKDMSNRQGLEENLYYDIFVDIIDKAISSFERYRQSIIRLINKKNKIEEKVETPIIDKVISNPQILNSLSQNDSKVLYNEIKHWKEEKKDFINKQVKNEEKYKYDIKILNMLATMGLKSASIAHETINDKINLSSNIDFIISALNKYNMWTELNSPEKTRVPSKNVPKLLDDTKLITRKVVNFMDSMLTNIEKNKFIEMELNVFEQISTIANKWCSDYNWVTIDIVENKVFKKMSSDVLIVIFDNLILNSIQNNENKNSLIIKIEFYEEEEKLNFIYSDNGIGLSKKYHNNPLRILEVHETTRTNGHGLGMWIVNNTILNTDGMVSEIPISGGFKLKFYIGGSGSNEN